ncbi:MAG: DUF3299 domain-containing protein [Planctomycetes bacterium]|nr:DUF3299 domain-containing protein [Planctomycetota bacterium]
MRIVWSILALICFAALLAVIFPTPAVRRDESGELAAVSPSSNQAAPSPTIVAAKPAAVIPSSSAAPTTAQPPVQPIAKGSVANLPVTAVEKPKAASTAISPDSLKLGLDRKIANATIVPGNLIKQSDGSILADNKYLISGAGTEADPYKITWECLTSASQTYIPRLQQNAIPQRVAMLDGAWVRIEGYMAFPLMLQESSEILVMLNQWDGCCIGVPPTPYDAIEVKLATPVKPGRRHTFNFGTITGKFKVDPYLVENWLVGLYQLESASLQSDM